ncbi:MAG: ABC transporter ATP-binding protein [Acidimicrobiales bacterium]|jgi:branched-chain amino acid transport system ATP-binding protein|nr:ABC transporter ATP-binding protein [Acidimicrobiales bacterium]
MLEVTGVTVRFGGLMAVRDVSLSAPLGTVTGLIGPNGAGKTTLFNVITGLGAPTSGRVSLDGVDITRLAPHKRARLGLSRTFQALQLFGTLTVAENIALAARRKGTAEKPHECAARLLEFLGIGHLADTHAHNVPTGQARLVELGRALATAPKLVLLDEPASGQDPDETEHFKGLLRQIAADGVGVLLVEHDIPLVMGVCSQIHVLDFGQLIARGTPEEIRRDERVIAAYLGTEEVDTTEAAAP